MTADERIEGLLNSFGQTISDLPKAEASTCAYSQEHLDSAFRAVLRWHGNRCFGMFEDCEDYICHLCDVIDRMEAALETAKLHMPCVMCGHADICDKVSSEEIAMGIMKDCDDFHIADYLLQRC